MKNLNFKLERIKIFNKIIPHTFNVPSDDLFNLAENSETWIKLKKNITRVVKIFLIQNRLNIPNML